MRIKLTPARRLTRARSAGRWPSVAVIVVLVSSCAGDPEASPQPASPSSISPSAAASPTEASSQTPAPSDDPQPQPALASDIVQVVADGLQLRSAAGTQASVVGGLERGALARVESAPVEADGFAWYEVIDLNGNIGWVASGDSEDAWVATVTDQPDGSALFRFESAGHVTGPPSLPPVTVMDDRRVVMGDFERGWRLARLTDVGFDRLSEAVLQSPYLQASAEYEPILRAGVTQGPAHGAGVYTFTVGDTGEPVVVRSVQWFGEEEEASFFEPSPERRALDGIADGLNTLEEALGADAWEAEPLPYVSDSFTVALSPGEGALPPGTARVDPSALPVDTALGDLDGPPPGGVCGDFTIAEAFELARVVRDAGADLVLDTIGYATFATDAGWFSVSLTAHAPDGYPGCADTGF